MVHGRDGTAVPFKGAQSKQSQLTEKVAGCLLPPDKEIIRARKGSQQVYTDHKAPQGCRRQGRAMRIYIPPLSQPADTAREALLLNCHQVEEKRLSFKNCVMDCEPFINRSFLIHVIK